MGGTVGHSIFDVQLRDYAERPGDLLGMAADRARLLAEVDRRLAVHTMHVHRPELGVFFAEPVGGRWELDRFRHEARDRVRQGWLAATGALDGLFGGRTMIDQQYDPVLTVVDGRDRSMYPQPVAAKVEPRGHVDLHFALVGGEIRVTQTDAAGREIPWNGEAPYNPLAPADHAHLQSLLGTQALHWGAGREVRIERDLADTPSLDSLAAKLGADDADWHDRTKKLEDEG